MRLGELFAARRTRLLDLLTRRSSGALHPLEIEDCTAIVEDWRRAIAPLLQPLDGTATLSDAVTLLREYRQVCDAVLARLVQAERCEKACGLVERPGGLASSARRRVAAVRRTVQARLQQCMTALRALRWRPVSTSSQPPREPLRIARVGAAELMFHALREVWDAARRREVSFAAIVQSGLLLSIDQRLVSSALVEVLADAVRRADGGSTVRAYARVEHGHVTLEVVSDAGDDEPGADALTVARAAVAAHDGQLAVSRGPGDQRIYRIQLPLFLN